MAKPYSIEETLQRTYFKPDRIISIYFAQDKFDKVHYKSPKGYNRPMYDKLDQAMKDVKQFRSAMKMYRLPGGDTTNIEFNLTKNSSNRKIMDTWE